MSRPRAYSIRPRARRNRVNGTRVAFDNTSKSAAGASVDGSHPSLLFARPHVIKHVTIHSSIPSPRRPNFKSGCRPKRWLTKATFVGVLVMAGSWLPGRSAHAQGGAPPAAYISSTPPKAVGVHEPMDYAIEISTGEVPVCSSVSGPASASVSSAGAVFWLPTQVGSATFQVDCLLSSGALVTDTFTVLVVEQLAPDGPRVLQAAGFDNPSELLDAGQTTSLHTEFQPGNCPLGATPSIDQSGGQACRTQADGRDFAHWVVIDRACETGACNVNHKYLDTRFTAHTNVGEDTPAKVQLFVAYDWRGGNPSWKAVAEVDPTVAAEELGFLAIMDKGVEAVLIARESKGATPLTLGNLEMMGASDLHIKPAPYIRATFADWVYAGEGLGPSADPDAGALRAFARRFESEGLRSYIRDSDSAGLVVLGRDDEIDTITGWEETQDWTLDSEWAGSDITSVAPNLQEGFDAAKRTFNITGVGWTIAIHDDGIDRRIPRYLNPPAEVCAELADSNNDNRAYCSLPCGADWRNSTHDVRVCEHGNGVAGTAASLTDGGAPGSQILMYRRYAVTRSSAIGDVRRRVEEGENIAAFNMSYGFNRYFSSTGGALETFDDLLRSGVAPITSAGNFDWVGACLFGYYQMGAGGVSGFPNLIPPSNVIMVSGVNENDEIHCGSKSDPIVHLAARGAAVPTIGLYGSGYTEREGTSYAAPRVAAAFAVLREFRPECSPQTVLQALQVTGVPVTETRGAFDFTTPRINVHAAAGYLANHPCKPEPPREVKVLSTTKREARVQWQDFSSNESGFEVKALPVPYSNIYGQFGGDAPPNRTLDSISPQISFAGTTVREPFLVKFLSPGIDYCVSVRSFRTDGATRQYSDWVSPTNPDGSCATVSTKPPEVPPKASAIRVTARNISSVTFEADWTDKTTYVKYVWYTGGRDYVATQTFTSSRPFRVTIPAGPNDGIDFYVRMCSGDGCSEWTLRRAFTGPTASGSAAELAANQPGAPPAVPQDLTAVQVNDTQVRLRWDEPTDELDLVEVRIRHPSVGCPFGDCWVENYYLLDGIEGTLLVTDPYLDDVGTLHRPGYMVRRCIRGGTAPIGATPSCSGWSNLAEL